MEVVIILVLILLNGIFSMAEIALVSARKVRLENAARQGDDKAKAALKLSNNPDTFLSTVQIGITLIGILTGLYSGEQLKEDVKSSFSPTGRFWRLTANGIATASDRYLRHLLHPRAGRTAAQKDRAGQPGADRQSWWPNP